MIIHSRATYSQENIIMNNSDVRQLVKKSLSLICNVCILRKKNKTQCICEINHFKTISEKIIMYTEMSSRLNTKQ